MIELKNVSYVYKSSQQKALKNVTLKVKLGEFVAVVGANNSGKSTLVKIINGLLIPTSGDTYVDNSPIKNNKKIWRLRQKIGFLFQNPQSQIVSSLVEEEVAFGPKNLGLGEEEIGRRITKSLEQVDMLDFRFEDPTRLSVGQKQKIAIAALLALRPRYFVLDEPTSYFNPSVRKEIISVIANICKGENTGVIYTTHFIDEVINADRIVVLDRGKIVKDCRPKEFFSDVEDIHRLGFYVPKWLALSHLLKKDGLRIKKEKLGLEGLVEKLAI